MILPGCPIRIAIAQLACHPSLTVGATDLSAEPLSPSSGDPIVASLIEHGFPIRDLAERFRIRYQQWHLTRVLSVLHSLYVCDDTAKHPESPDMVVFPEGSIPMGFLPFLSAVAQAYNTTIFAGTHAFKPNEGRGIADYYDMMNDKDFHEQFRQEFEAVDERALDTVSILPVLLPDGRCFFRVKQVLSPHEFAGYTVNEATDRKQPQISTVDVPFRQRQKGDKNAEVKVPSLRVAPYICAEALQIPDARQPFDLAVVVSYNQNFNHFEPFVRYHTLRRRPVVYCNDGAFGDSCVSIPVDTRGDAWWFSEVNKGRLPAGDAVLVMDVAVGAGITVGVTATDQPYAVRRLADILPQSDELPSHIGQSLRTIANSVEKRTARVSEVEETERTLASFCERPGATPLQQRKLPRLLNLLKADSLTAQRWPIYTADVFLAGPQNLAEWRENEHSPTPPQLQLSALRLKLNMPTLKGEFETASHSTSAPLESQSLSALEQTFLTDCYLRIRQLLDDRLPRESDRKSAALRQLVEARDRCAHALKFRPGAPLLSSLWNTLARTEEESIEAATSALTHRLGYFVERFNGTCGWIFSLNADNERLPTEAAINTLHLTKKRNQGMVGYSVTTKAPLLENDVKNEVDSGTPDRHPYKEYLRTTRSELTIPLLDIKSTAKYAMGVMNLESRAWFSFSPTMVGDSQSASYALVPDLCLLTELRRNLRGYGWHPQKHGWHLTTILDSICLAVASSVPGRASAPTVSCTIWMPEDVDATRLSARATARFDYEYLQDMTLSVSKSFIGEVFRQPVGTVVINAVEQLPNFQRPGKAKRMEVRKVIATPIANPSKGKTIGVLAIYLFEYQFGPEVNEVDEFFKPDAVARVAEIIGGFIDHMSDLQVGYAQRYLESRLRAEVGNPTDIVNTVRDVLLECLGADACSIFVRHESERPSMQCVSTTGLTMNGCAIDATEDILLKDVRPIRGVIRAARYDVDPECRTGYTNFLALRPDTVLRRNDVGHSLSGSERGPRPANTFCEKTNSSELDHQRFLGYSIRDEKDPVALAVIRLVRGDNSYPFYSPDDEMVRALASTAAPWLRLFQASFCARRPIKLPAKAVEFSNLAVSPKEHKLINLALDQIRSPALFYAFGPRAVIHHELVTVVQTLLQYDCQTAELLYLKPKEKRAEAWELVHAFRKNVRSMMGRDSMMDAAEGTLTVCTELAIGLWQNLKGESGEMGPRWSLSYPFQAISLGGTLELCLRLTFGSALESPTQVAALASSVAFHSAHRLRSVGQQATGEDVVRNYRLPNPTAFLPRLEHLSESIQCLSVFVADPTESNWLCINKRGSFSDGVADDPIELLERLSRTRWTFTVQKTESRQRLDWELHHLQLTTKPPFPWKTNVLHLDERPRLLLQPLHLGMKTVALVVLQIGPRAEMEKLPQTCNIRQELLRLAQRIDCLWRSAVDDMYTADAFTRRTPNVAVASFLPDGKTISIMMNSSTSPYAVKEQTDPTDIALILGTAVAERTAT
jgi:hypothetical protein